MNTNNLTASIRKCYFPRVILPAVLIAACIVFAIINPFESRYKSADLKKLSDTADLYENHSGYVRFTAETLYYAGIDYRANGRIRARVYYTINNDVFYFFLISTEELPEDYGTLHNYEMNARLVKNGTLFRRLTVDISKELGFPESDFEDLCSHIIVSQYHYVHGVTSFYLIALLVLCILSVIQLSIIILILAMPQLSHAAFMLRHYGSRRGLYGQACEEFASSATLMQENIYMTENFLIYTSGFHVEIIPLENIVWLYNYNVIHKTKGRAKAYFPLCIVTDCKKIYKIHHINQQTSDKIIDIIQTRYPEVMVGYDN